MDSACESFVVCWVKSTRDISYFNTIFICLKRFNQCLRLFFSRSHNIFHSFLWHRLSPRSMAAGLRCACCVAKKSPRLIIRKRRMSLAWSEPRNSKCILTSSSHFCKSTRRHQKEGSAKLCLCLREENIIFFAYSIKKHFFGIMRVPFAMEIEIKLRRTAEEEQEKLRVCRRNLWHDENLLTPPTRRRLKILLCEIDFYDSILAFSGCWDCAMSLKIMRVLFALRGMF